MHRMTNQYPEWIAAIGASAGWVTVLAGNLKPFITIGTFLLTVISIYLVLPKLSARMRTDLRRLQSWFKRP